MIMRRKLSSHSTSMPENSSERRSARDQDHQPIPPSRNQIRETTVDDQDPQRTPTVAEGLLRQSKEEGRLRLHKIEADHRPLLHASRRDQVKEHVLRTLNSRGSRRSKWRGRKNRKRILLRLESMMRSSSTTMPFLKEDEIGERLIVESRDYAASTIGLKAPSFRNSLHRRIIRRVRKNEVIEVLMVDPHRKDC
jgi:hypothetical protein